MIIGGPTMEVLDLCTGNVCISIEYKTGWTRHVATLTVEVG